jgi:hypothetical protein
LLDLELSIDFKRSSADLWSVMITHDALDEPARLTFAFDDGRPIFQWVGTEPVIKVIRNDDEVPLIDYLLHHPLAFYLEDFSRVDGGTIHYNKQGRKLTIPTDCLRALEWSSANIDIELEFPEETVDFTNPTTVQEFLGQRLIDSSAPIVFYDHGSGEMADFLTFNEVSPSSILLQLYHCKASGGPRPGDRVGDAYEVCGQVVKCLVWLKNRQALRGRIANREQSTNGKSRLIKGTRSDLQRLLSDDDPKKLDVEILVVQPGIPIGAISEKIGHILGAAADYIRRASGAKMLLIGS